VAPDEAKFFDWAKTRVAFGWEETYVENGQSLVLNEGVAKL
jgi:GTPase